MIKIPDEIIKEIAEELDCGMLCYYNTKKNELYTIIDYDTAYGDTELWEDVQKEIDENISDCILFEKMESHEAFEVMADFTQSLDNLILQEQLLNALNNRKPFQNFKWRIDNSGEYRQQWFDFKNSRYIEYVKEQIENFNRDEMSN